MKRIKKIFPLLILPFTVGLLASCGDDKKQEDPKIYEAKLAINTGEAKVMTRLETEYGATYVAKFELKNVDLYKNDELHFFYNAKDVSGQVMLSDPQRNNLELGMLIHNDVKGADVTFTVNVGDGFKAFVTGREEDKPITTVYNVIVGDYPNAKSYPLEWKDGFNHYGRNIPLAKGQKVVFQKQQLEITDFMYARSGENNLKDNGDKTFTVKQDFSPSEDAYSIVLCETDRGLEVYARGFDKYSKSYFYSINGGEKNQLVKVESPLETHFETNVDLNKGDVFTFFEGETKLTNHISCNTFDNFRDLGNGSFEVVSAYYPEGKTTIKFTFKSETEYQVHALGYNPANDKFTFKIEGDPTEYDLVYDSEYQSEYYHYFRTTESINENDVYTFYCNGKMIDSGINAHWSSNLRELKNSSTFKANNNYSFNEKDKWSIELKYVINEDRFEIGSRGYSHAVRVSNGETTITLGGSQAPKYIGTINLTVGQTFTLYDDFDEVIHNRIVLFYNETETGALHKDDSDMNAPITVVGDSTKANNVQVIIQNNQFWIYCEKDQIPA